MEAALVKVEETEKDDQQVEEDKNTPKFPFSGSCRRHVDVAHLIKINIEINDQGLD